MTTIPNEILIEAREGIHAEVMRHRRALLTLMNTVATSLSAPEAGSGPVQATDFARGMYGAPDCSANSGAAANVLGRIMRRFPDSKRGMLFAPIPPDGKPKPAIPESAWVYQNGMARTGFPMDGGPEEMAVVLSITKIIQGSTPAGFLGKVVLNGLRVPNFSAYIGGTAREPEIVEDTFTCGTFYRGSDELAPRELKETRVAYGAEMFGRSGSPGPAVMLRLDALMRILSERAPGTVQ